MNLQMIYKYACFLLFFATLFSCKEDNQNREAVNKKEAKKKEIVFSNISKGWVFYDTPINSTSESTLVSWSEWRSFMRELAQKPNTTIGSFQQKAKALTEKGVALNENIPEQFNKPQIKSRIATLVSKLQMLDLHIHLNTIPDDKVLLLISEINLELVSLQRQMDKIVEKSKIPVEEGESDILMMMDTARAIPNVKIDKNLPIVD
jgi:hypothetical protein